MKFTKMQGLGNDFIIIDAKDVLNLKYSELAKKICNRNFGIGADGLIITNPPKIKTECDISWKIFNSDGSEAEMCGNGIRCFAKYVYEKGIINKKKFSIQTLAGKIVPEILDNNQIKVNMGEPVIEPLKIPVLIDADSVINYPLEIEGKNINITTVGIGNPHCIVFTDEDPEILAKTLGPKLETHKIFPQKTNVEIVKIISKNKIRVDVWERGCGITLACGTGACASVVAAVLNNFTENSVNVELPGGNLYIEWIRPQNELFMTGGCEFVFEGEYFLY